MYGGLSFIISFICFGGSGVWKFKKSIEQQKAISKYNSLKPVLTKEEQEALPVVKMIYKSDKARNAVGKTIYDYFGRGYEVLREQWTQDECDATGVLCNEKLTMIASGRMDRIISNKMRDPYV